MMGKKFGIGIIGCGEISASHYRAYQEIADHCEIVALSDAVEAAAKRRAQEFGVETVYTDYHDLLADKRVDVVAICTPHYLHAPMTIAAANAGKHVLVEKPMCMNVGEVQEMVYAAKKNGVKLTMSSEQVNPRHRWIKEHVMPEIGDIEFTFLVDFYYRNIGYYEKARWRGTWDREGGGIFVNQAIYTWDTWQWLMGGVDTAYGYWANLLHPNIEVEDIGYGLVRFRNGQHGKLFATSICEEPTGTVWMRIAGSKGEIFAVLPWLYTIDFSLHDKSKEEDLRDELEQHLAGLQGPGLQQWNDTHDRRVLLQMYDIIQAVREDRAVTIDPESCGESMKILNGIHWGGWNHSEAFKTWAYTNFELPPPSKPGALPTVDDARKQNWRGGRLVETLVDFVKDPEPTLAAPFL
jgi:UDP-N-acetyl-2-amino-2-deoxyglucuronate dehydrogenase